MSDNNKPKKKGRGGGKIGRKWKTVKVQKAEAEIVQVLLGNPSARTAKAIAEVLGKPESTVARLMKSPEVKIRMKEILYDFVDKDLIYFAVKNIKNAITKDENVSDSKWLLEHVEFFPDQDKTQEDNWAIFQRALGEGIANILQNVKGGDGDIDGLDPDTLVYYQPKRPTPVDSN